jgi:transposase
LQTRGERIVEVDRPKRLARHAGAKSDTLDPARAAWEALAHEHPLAPRQRGDREALRVLLATWGTAPASRKWALHTIVVARLRDDPDTRAYAARRRSESESVRDIRRCLKQAVARQLFKLLERYDHAGCSC